MSRLVFFAVALTLAVLLVAGCSIAQARLLRDETGNGVVVDPDPALEEVTLTLFFPDRYLQYSIAEERQVLIQQGTAERAAVRELLAGPSAPYLTGSFPPEAGLLSLEVVDRIAYVNMDGSTRVSEGLEEEAAVRSLVLTLTELDTVDRVQILVDGKSNLSLSGQFALGQPLDRGDVGGLSASPEIAAQSDRIKIFSPAPGTPAISAIEIWGLAQVYESEFVYEVWVDDELRAEGSIVTSDWDWGHFRERVWVGARSGSAALLRLYSHSAKDGSPMHLVEIPLEMEMPEVVAESERIRMFSPSPGESVGEDFVFWGIAQVYEGTVVYELWQDDALLAEGFATADDFDWGSFQETVSVPPGNSGQALLRIYSPSAKDGSPMGLIELPLILK